MWRRALRRCPRPRLWLQPDLSARTPLDGGWWPRSGDPVAELPGLILAIERRRGPVTKVTLGNGERSASLRQMLSEAGLGAGAMDTRACGQGPA